MIWLPALAGGAAGVGIILVMYRVGMLRERAGLAVLLAAIASFYPVFAAADGDVAAAVLHGLIFVAFTFLAVQGFRKTSVLLAGGLIAHGIFDLAMLALPSPGPLWWPAFCGALDIAAGLALVRLMQRNRVPG